jgi:hypothetical protein
LSEICKWLHEQLEILPIVKYPFDLKTLPNNGVYFFYEEGENASHSNNSIAPRIVRIGTHRENNFRSRISEHFLLNESKMNFSNETPKPSDRSIFRKNIGRALLNKQSDDYLKIWNIDFTTSDNKKRFSQLRNTSKEKEIEIQITTLIRNNFWLRSVPIEGQEQRMGKMGIESRLIGTVTRCEVCKPSQNWLGAFSPVSKINSGKLWLYQHLNSLGLTDIDKLALAKSINDANAL